MNIWIDDKRVRIFKGATAGDALRRFSEALYRQVAAGEKRLLNGHGHEVALSGELSENQRFHTK